jgi:hypothetical protein
MLDKGRQASGSGIWTLVSPGDAVIPAQAGIQSLIGAMDPAPDIIDPGFAGVTVMHPLNPPLK